MSACSNIPQIFSSPELVGQGMHSRTYRARDERTGATVAVKMLRPIAWLNPSEEAARRARLMETLQAIQVVSHPSLVGQDEIYELNNSLFTVRPYMQGFSLREVVTKHGCLTQCGGALLAEQLAGVLEAFSLKGFSHDAITPENVFFDDAGDVYLTDALFSKTAGQFSVGGFECQIQSRRPISDIQSLSILCYEAMTGQFPYHTDGAYRYAWALSPTINAVMLRALTARHGGFRTAGELAAAMQPARLSLFRLVWRPSAALGLLGALLTVGGYAASERRVSPKAVILRPVHISTLAPISAEDSQAIRLALRRQGAGALTHPLVAQAFELSDDQYRQLEQCLAEQHDRINTMVENAANGSIQNTSNIMNEIRETTTASILMILNEDQRVRWQDLTGITTQKGESIL